MITTYFASPELTLSIDYNFTNDIYPDGAEKSDLNLRHARMRPVVLVAAKPPYASLERKVHRTQVNKLFTLIK